ncbi:MAG: hypothetical protein FWD65_03385 [Coriobacteriia bacterium]|nr:hypothetical protein [Coriobacteriia bacterium]
MAFEERQDIHAPVVVLETTCEDDLALAKTMLMSANIPFSIKNDPTDDMFGMGRVGWEDHTARSLELRVAPRDADDAYKILKSLDRPGTAAIDRNDPGKRAREEEQVAIFATQHKNELEAIEARLRAAGISYLVTAKMVDHVTQVQVTVARRDVVDAKIVIAMPEESAEEAPDPIFESQVLSNSKELSSMIDQDFDYQIARWRLFKRILLVALILLLILIFFVLPIENSLTSSPDPNGVDQSAISGSAQ